MEIKSGVGPILSVVSVVASGIGRGLVVKSGDWSAGMTGVGREERDLSVGASGIQRGLIGDRYALQSERVIFLPDHTRPRHKNWSALVGGWSALWCECRFKEENLISYFIGGSEGIGAATALHLAEKGAKLSLAARNIDNLNSVAESCKMRGLPEQNVSIIH